MNDGAARGGPAAPAAAAPGAPGEPLVRLAGLGRSFGELVAVDGLELAVARRDAAPGPVQRIGYLP